MSISKRRALLFSGQGAQKVGMGADLYERSPSAHALYELADSRLGWPLSDYSFRGPAEILTETRVCQPALYVHGIAILAAFQDLTGRALPFQAAAGLSLGEYTAHAAAGSFTFQTGLDLVKERGRLMQEACDATAGTMVTLLGATPEQAREIAGQCGVDVANLNCPGQIVLSGGKREMEAVAAVAKERGVRKAIPLNVAGAYHSRLMASAAMGLAHYLTQAEIAAPKVPVVANYTADITGGADQILRALEAQVCGSVRWEESIRRLIGLGFTDFAECGPGGVLAGLARRIDPAVNCLSLESCDDLVKHADALI
ncbi:MAG TPA: ACP S-malonyltransferase [Candidatus Methylacidiphilales bacterium]|nr:ACP S-malonyltransferase [Candidatus Methylacidiphilales bacterium]